MIRRHGRATVLPVLYSWKKLYSCFPNRNFGNTGHTHRCSSIDHAGAVCVHLLVESPAHPRHIIPQQREVAVKGQLSEIYSLSFVFLIFFCIPYLLLHSYWLYIFFGKGLSHCLLNSLCSLLFIEKSSSPLHCPKPLVFKVLSLASAWYYF